MRARLNLNPAHWSVRVLAEIGVAIALAAVLGQIRLFVMPQGGSVSLELLPIIFIAVRRRRRAGPGDRPAVRAATARPPGGLHLPPGAGRSRLPAGFHGALAVAGFVDVRGWRSLTLAVTLALGARFVFHFLSGLIFFASYAPAWEAAWLYSMTYNLLYLVPEGVITVLLLWPLLKAYDAAFPGTGPGGGGVTAEGDTAARGRTPALCAAVFLDGDYEDAGYYTRLARAPTSSWRPTAAPGSCCEHGMRAAARGRRLRLAGRDRPRASDGTPAWTS